MKNIKLFAILMLVLVFASGCCGIPDILGPIGIPGI